MKSRIGFLRLARAGQLVIPLLFMASFADAQGLPSFSVGSGTLKSPTEADDLYCAAPSNCTTSGTRQLWATNYPVEIAALAKALKNDVDVIYQYVRNNVETVPMYGLQKGALGALIDRSGTPFDQAQLMVELLRSSGYTASYVSGAISLNQTQINSWLGTSNAAAIQQILADGGIPATVTPTSGTVSTVTLSHIWVRVAINGTNYVFDPSFKAHTFTAPIDFATATGWNDTTYLNQARSGYSTGTTTAPKYGVPNVNVTMPWVSNLNNTASGGQLTSYANNLVNYLRTNGYASKQIDDVVGRQDIVIDSSAPRQTSLSYESSTPAQRVWSTHIPDIFRVKVTVEYFYINTSVARLSQTLFADEIYGRQVYYDTYQTAPNWNNDSVQLKVDGLAVGGLYTGNDRADVRAGNVRLSIDHPYLSNSGTYMDRTGASALVMYADFVSPVVIVVGFGDVSDRLLDKLTSEQADDKLLPFSAFYSCGGLGQEGGCEPVDKPQQPAGLTTLVRASAGWMSQYTRMATLSSRMLTSVHQLHHVLGIANRRSAVGVTHPNVNPPAANGAMWSVNQGAFVLHVDTGVSVSSKAAIASDRETLARSLAVSADTLEASQFEQSGGSATPASVAHRFQWSVVNNPAKKFYLLTPAATSFQPFPDGEYPYYNLSSDRVMDDYIDAGFTIIAAEDQFLGPGKPCATWPTSCEPANRTVFDRGGAFQAISADRLTTANIITDTISRPLKGGSAASPPVYDETYAPDKSQDLIKDQFKDRSRDFGVDLSSGDFTYSSSEDISVGSGEFPYKLSLNRSFRPGESHSPGFGKGWTHNFDIRMALGSDGNAALGKGPSLAAAASLVALYATQRIYGSVPGTDAGLLQRWVTVPLIQAWWAEKIRFNQATYTAGSTSKTFLRMPDGRFLPPEGNIPAVGDSSSYWKLTQTGSPTGYGEQWSYSGVSFTLESPSKDVQTFGFYRRPHRAIELPNQHGPKHGWHVTNWTWPTGISLTFSYAPINPAEYVVDDHLVYVQNSLGRRLNFTFVPSVDWQACNVQSVDDGQGNTFSFNCANKSVTSPAGDVTKYVYGAANCAMGPWPDRTKRPRCSPYLIEMFGPTDSTDPTLRFTYDEVGNVDTFADAVAIKSPGSRQPYRFYISDGTRGERKDPAGNSFTVYYDAWGRATQFIDELGYTTFAQYDGLGRVVKRWSPESILTEFDYNFRGDPTMLRTTPKPTSPATLPTSLTVSATYDTSCGGLKTITDANGNVTTWNYSATTCQVLNVVQPTVLNGETGANAAPTSFYTYTGTGLVNTFTDPSGLLIDFDYDAAGNRTLQKIDPFGLNLQKGYGYDSVGNITSITTGNGNTTNYTYDAERRVTRITSPAATCKITDNVWQGGLVTKVRNAKVCNPNFATDTDWQVWLSSYTPTGKIDVVTDPSGGTNDTDYDALDRVEYVRQSLGGSESPRVTRTTYNATGLEFKVFKGWGSADQITYSEKQYTPDGNLDWIKDANANLTDFDYDGYGRQLKTTFPDATFELLGYDNNGNQTSKRNRSGVIISTTFDALNRSMTRTVPDNPNYAGNFARTLTTTYDLASRKWDMTADGQTLRNRFDSARRLQRVEDSLLNTLGANIGNVEYTYDASSNMKTVGFYATQGFLAPTYSYDAGERLWKIASGATTLVQFGFDPLSRLQTASYVDTTSMTRTYEPDDDLESITHAYNGGTLAFSYSHNGAHQLRAATTSSASHIAPQPLPPASYAVNSLNQYTSTDGATLIYDLNGNLIGDGTWTYSYDEENRLRQAVSSTVTAVYAYDPMGRRRSKTVNGVVTHFVYDADKELADFGPTGSRIRYYVNASNVDDRVAVYDEATSAWLVPHTNHQGSIVLTTLSTSNGGIGNTFDYGPYGESSAAITGFPFRFTGRYLDAETGLYYYRARYYNPRLGRFLQTDPVGTKDDLNLYGYVGNDPLNNIDPTGMWSWKAAASFVADFVPVVGDIKGIVEAIQDPSIANIAAAVVSLVPVVGDVAGKAIKIGAKALDKGADVARKVVHSSCCFVAGTPIQTSEGLRAIDAIKIGDLVLSRDSETGQTEYKPVLALIRRHDRAIWTVEFSGAESSETKFFSTTDDHPWRTVDGAWVSTDELRVGMRIQRMAGAPVTVLGVVHTDRIEPTFNLEVADYHTYFVGEAGVWVHNACRVPQNHHIVPKGDGRAAGAREKMQDAGISVKNDSDNIHKQLSGDKHNITMRESYVTEVNARIGGLTDAAAIRKELNAISAQLNLPVADLERLWPPKK